MGFKKNFNKSTYWILRSFRKFLQGLQQSYIQTNLPQQQVPSFLLRYSWEKRRRWWWGNMILNTLTNKQFWLFWTQWTIKVLYKDDKMTLKSKTLPQKLGFPRKISWKNQTCTYVLVKRDYHNFNWKIRAGNFEHNSAYKSESLSINFLWNVSSMWLSWNVIVNLVISNFHSSFWILCSPNIVIQVSTNWFCKRIHLGRTKVSG